MRSGWTPSFSQAAGNGLSHICVCGSSDQLDIKFIQTSSRSCWYMFYNSAVERQAGSDISNILKEAV